MLPAVKNGCTDFYLKAAFFDMSHTSASTCQDTTFCDSSATTQMQSTLNWNGYMLAAPAYGKIP